MNEIGTEIKLYTHNDTVPTIKVKFLEDAKKNVKRAMVAIRNDELINFDTLTHCTDLLTNVVESVGKKIKKSNDIYNYINNHLSRQLAKDFEITHLKIHPLLQTRKAGAGFTIFNTDVKETYFLEPKRRFEEILKKEKKESNNAK